MTEATTNATAGTDATADAQNPATDPASGAGSAPATDAAGEGRPAAKARVFTDDVRKSIVARHREHRQAQLDPSLSAARSESARVAQTGAPDGSNEGAGGAAAGGSAVGNGGSPAPSGDAGGSETVRVKVYGQEYDVPADVVEAAGGKAAYQKAAAADVLLKQAAEANARAQRAAQEIEARAQQATIPAAGASNAKSGPPSGDSGDASTALKDESRELLDAVLDSNPDRVAAALGKALTKVKATAAPASAAPNGTPPPAGPARSELEITTANAVFDTEFSGIRSNKPVMAVARDMMRARMNDPAFANVPLPELARAIGKHLASTFPTVSQTAAGDAGRANVDATLELRERAKRQIPSTRTASQIAGSPPPPPPQPSREQKASSFVQMLRARSGSNATIAERRALNQR